MVASTVEKRLSVLEAKDKAEHERRHTVPGYPVLSSNLSEKQTVTVGTCPDMCPEKERHVLLSLVSPSITHTAYYQILVCFYLLSFWNNPLLDSPLEILKCARYL